MPNPLFNELGGNNAVNNNIVQLMNEVQNFRRTFRGNPKDEVQRMLNEGKLTQNQFNQYAQMANKIMAMMPK